MGRRRWQLIAAAVWFVSVPSMPSEHLAAARGSTAALMGGPRLASYVSNRVLGVFIVRPASLINDTELEVLSDVPFLATFPFPPSEIATVIVSTVFDSMDGSPTWAVEIRFQHEIDRMRVVHWLSPGAQPDAISQPARYRPTGKSGLHLAFPDSATVLASSDAALLDAQLSAGSVEGEMSSLRRRLDVLPAETNAAAIIDLGRLRLLGESLFDPVEDGSARQTLLSLPADLSLVIAQVRFGKTSSRLEISFVARQGVQDSSFLRDWVPKAHVSVKQSLGQLKHLLELRLPPEHKAAPDALIEQFVAFFAGLRPDLSGDSPVLRCDRLPSISRVSRRAASALGVAVVLAREAAREAQRSNNLKQLLLAWQQSSEKGLTNIADPDGRALLSWRVALLPKLGLQKLYDAFRLDESWDSPHNIRLVPHMPAVFADPVGDSRQGLTRLQAATGKGTVFGDTAPWNRIRDGLANTVGMVEAEHPIIWTKPGDFDIVSSPVYAALHRTADAQTLLAFMDGSVRRYPKLAEQTYRKLFLHSDGAPLAMEELDPATPRPAAMPTIDAGQLGPLVAAIDAADLPSLRGNLEKVIQAWKAGDLRRESPLKAQLLAKLQRLARSDQPLVRIWAGQAYLAMVDAQSINWDLAESLLRDRELDPLRWQAAHCLAGIPDPRSVRLLCTVPVEDEAMTGELLRRRLSRVAADSAITLLENDDLRIRQRACRLIGDAGNPNHIPQLQPLLADDKTHEVAAAAIAAIERRAAGAAELARQQENRQQLQRRNALWQAAQKAAAEKDFPGAVATAKEMLSVEQRLLGETHDEVLSTLRWIAKQCENAGDQAAARAILQKFAATVSKRFGETHWRAVNARLELAIFDDRANVSNQQRDRLTEADKLQQSVVLLLKTQDFKKAAETLQAALDSYRAMYGDTHVLTTNLRRDLRNILVKLGDYKQAESLGGQIVEAGRGSLGPEHPLALDDVVEWGMIAYLNNDRTKAINILSGMPARLEAAGNSQKAGIAGRLLGQLLAAEGKLEAATTEFDRAFSSLAGNQKAEAALITAGLATLKQKSGDPAMATSLRFTSHWNYRFVNPLQGMVENYAALADMYRDRGQTHLELVLRKTLAESLETALTNAPALGVLCASAHTSLAGTYLSLGDFALAEESLAKVLRYTGNSGGKGFMIDVATYLAAVKEHRGDLPAAERLLQEAVRLAEQGDSAMQRRTASCLRNLAVFCLDHDKPSAAKPLIERAVKLSNPVPEREDARCLAALARTEQMLGQTARAREVAAQGERLLQATKNAPADDPVLLLEFSKLFLLLNDRERSIALCRKALDACQGVGGAESLPFAEMQAHLAHLRFLRGEVDAAFREAIAAWALGRRLAERSAYLMSPRQQIAMGQLARQIRDTVLSIGFAGEQEPVAVYRQIFDWKGAALVRQRAVQELAEKEEVAPFYLQLGAITGQLATVTRRADDLPDDPRQAEIEQLNRQVAQLTALKELLEGQLSAARLAYLDLQPVSTYEDFVKAIPTDGVFVDYLVYQRVEPAGGSTARLAAAVTRRDGRVAITDLGPMGPVEAAIGLWRRSFGTSAAGRQAGAQLRGLIWDPLLPHLAGARTILVSPDESLGRVPLGALPGKDEGRYLIEDYRIALIPMPQLLPRLVDRPKPPRFDGQLLVIGDVDYDAAGPGSSAPGGAERVRGPSPQCSTRFTRGGEQFAALPSTAAEIVAIKRLAAEALRLDAAKVQVLSRDSATEAAFRELAPQAATIHLATHGFFADERKRHAESSTAKTSTWSMFDGNSRDSLQVFNPGLLSGLAFAGVNRPMIATGDDGILTAEEIATLPLERVELAVLSACETGLGRVAGGEGLIGMQRAFQAGGARTTVASLWKVDDYATRILMERFYQKCWTSGESKLDALREAQLWMLNHAEELAVHRKSLDSRGVIPIDGEPAPASRRLSPRYWAAFVISGDWR